MPRYDAGNPSVMRGTLSCSGSLWSCEEIGIRRFPSLHHRKEGWPSDQKIIAKHPLIARPGWFSDENKRKTTPAASVSVAARNFIDDAATPPCGDARRGITLDSNSFTAPMTDDSANACFACYFLGKALSYLVPDGAGS